MLEKIKEKIAKKPDILTPEIEKQIRADERIQFAKSFNFGSLMTENDPPNNWLTWVPVGCLVLLVIILAKVW